MGYRAASKGGGEGKPVGFEMGEGTGVQLNDHLGIHVGFQTVENLTLYVRQLPP